MTSDGNTFIAKQGKKTLELRFEGDQIIATKSKPGKDGKTESTTWDLYRWQESRLQRRLEEWLMPSEPGGGDDASLYQSDKQVARHLYARLSQ